MEIVNFLAATLTPATDWLTTFVASHPIFATLITVSSVVSSMWNNHKNRAATVFGHSMQAITHLDQRWESDDLKRHRCIASKFLLERLLNAESKAFQTRSEEEAINVVLNFLETVGCFVRTNAIAPRTAWQLFGSAAQLYVEAAEKQLAEYRRLHPTVYSEVQYLYLTSRVEEERRNLPFAWLWKRIAATRLSYKAGVGGGREWCDRVRYVYYIFYAASLSRVHESQRLPTLLDDAQVIKNLSRESHLGPQHKKENHRSARSIFKTP